MDAKPNRNMATPTQTMPFRLASLAPSSRAVSPGIADETDGAQIRSGASRLFPSRNEDASGRRGEDAGVIDPRGPTDRKFLSGRAAGVILRRRLGCC